MIIVNHGGGCCGMRHIYGMGTGSTGQLQELVAAVNRNILIEIVMTDGQCQNRPEILRKMEELGFVLVNRSQNPNTTNIINVFHRTNAHIQMSRLPYQWTGGRAYGEVVLVPDFRVGDAVVVSNPRSKFNVGTGTIVSVKNSVFTVRIAGPAGGTSRQIAQNLRKP